MKISSGYKTTEFWLAAIPTLVVVIKQFTGVEFEAQPIVDGILGLIAVIGSVSYIISRTKIKVEEIRSTSKK